MSTDVESRVEARMEETKKFILRFEESTDMSKHAQLMAFSEEKERERERWADMTKAVAMLNIDNKIILFLSPISVTLVQTDNSSPKD